MTDSHRSSAPAQASEELEACVALQKEVWNFDDVDLIPLRLFVVATKIGGQVIGAFDGDELIGFAMSIPGTRGGNPYLHSHMLAVRESFRNTGLGRKLKLAQRDDALGRGIRLIEWTFDPLEIRNAWLNIERLGAIARRYNLKPIRHVLLATARRAARPTALWPNGGSIRSASLQFSVATRASRR